MTLSIYLHFNGNCREAFDFYRSVFGGDFDVLQTFGDGPADMGVPDDERDNIMHVSLPVGTSVLMGSDVPSTFGSPVKEGRQHLNLLRLAQPGGDRRPVRETRGRRHRDNAPAGHVLGRLLRVLHRQVRHRLDDQLRAAAGVALRISR